MTEVSESHSSAAERRNSRYARYGWVLLTKWRKLLAAALYVLSAVCAALIAWQLCGDGQEPFRIPLTAALSSWTIVAMVRGFDGRFLVSEDSKQPHATPQERLVRRWLQGTTALSLLLLASTIVARVNI